MKLQHTFITKAHSLPRLFEDVTKLSHLMRAIERESMLDPIRYDPEHYKGERDPLRQDQLRIHLMQLDATILAYRKCTRAYQREHQARRAKAQAAGIKRFVHLNEWFRV